MNQRGMTLEATVGLIAALLFLAFLVAGFTTQWFGFSSWFPSNNVKTIQDQCSRFCSQGNSGEYDFCNQKREIILSMREKIYETCYYFSQTDEEGYKGLIDKCPDFGDCVPVVNEKDKLAQRMLRGEIYSKSDVFIVLDPGHGGTDPGAIGVGGIYEKSINLDVALKVKQKLVALGYNKNNIDFTRIIDKSVSLESRCAQAVALQADILVSVHCNAAQDAAANGIETIYRTNDLRIASKNLANSVHPKVISSANEYLKSLSVVSSLVLDRKVKSDKEIGKDPLAVLNCKSPYASSLVEIGFITNDAEGKRLATVGYQEAIAEGIAKGIDSYAEEYLLPK
ncbi:MAG TPA: N-acetylmuramoyl-L-alanine amidase [Candidatus Pacearchaeota archaeon]|nr:N-acetylmuramoyl-L-alanine amidase [Candidatus Pacearchaeota archaeon]